MIKRTIRQLSITEADFYVHSLEIFMLISDEEPYLRGELDLPDPLLLDYFHDGAGYDDPKAIRIQPLEILDERISEPDVLPNPPVLYSYTSKQLDLEIKDRPLLEVIRTVLKAADRNYERIAE